MSDTSLNGLDCMTCSGSVQRVKKTQSQTYKQLRFQKRKTPAGGFSYQHLFIDILKTLLHKCRVSPSEGITVLNFLSADANSKYVLAQSAHAYYRCKTYFSSPMAHAHML